MGSIALVSSKHIRGEPRRPPESSTPASGEAINLKME